ncbi:MAG TPA: J domain-containing protein [Anaerolineae bacterium]
MQSRDQLKHKLKALRQAEITIRFKYRNVDFQPGDLRARLIWNEFFALKPSARGISRYSLDELAKLDHEQLKQVFADYFAFVYFQYYKENGLTLDASYDPHLLAQMGLPPQAGPEEIKKRFRELAKKYHPDTGGNSKQFIQLMDVYNHLAG